MDSKILLNITKKIEKEDILILLYEVIVFFIIDGKKAINMDMYKTLLIYLKTANKDSDIVNYQEKITKFEKMLS